MGFAAKHLTEAERERIARGLFTVTSAEEHKGELHGLCPIHGEEHPSFSYNYKQDTYHCFSCGAAGDLLKLFCEVRGFDQKEGFKAFCAEHGIEHSRDATKGKGRRQGAGDEQNLPPPDLEQAWDKFKKLPAAWIERLGAVRGWTPEWIEILDLRLQSISQKGRAIHEPDRVAIPIRDAAGRLVNIRLYKPGGGEFKIVSWAKGLGKARLFPARPLHDGLVLLCEGEPDTICALSHGFNAITQTSKTTRWPEEHLAPFRNRDVIVAYDADQPGQRHAQTAAANLAPVAKSVRLLEWPDFMGRRDGKWPEDHGDDLTDFFVKHRKTPEELQELINAAKPFETEKASRSTDLLQFFEFGVNKRFSFKPRLLAETIIKEVPLLSDPETGLLYRWNGQWWEVFDEDHIRNMAIRYLGNESQKSRIEDAVYQVKMLSTIEPGRMVNDQRDWICLRNCMLNLYTYEMRPHEREYYCTYALSVAFDPDSDQRCERWERYLAETIQTAGPIAQAQEFGGYILMPHTKYEKCLFLLGPGSDGKSTFMKVMKEIVGDENCAAVSFPDLEKEFHRSSLYHKMLNISTEIGGQAIESPYFKAITSGDPMNAAFKHHDVFTFSPYCKMIFAGNILPRVRDNSDGFFRRILPITFKKQFLENDPERDPDLFDELKQEISEIFYWCLCGHKRLTKQRRFTDCDETRSLMMGYRRSNNPVLCFVEDECLVGEDCEVAKAELYGDYRKYCGENGYMAVHRENFFRELHQAIHNLKLYRPRVGNDRPTYIRGIGKKPASS